MKNLTKNGENLEQKIPCYPDMGCVETMNKKQLMKLISAFVMGDGSLEKHGKNSRISISHSINNLDYLNWKKRVLEQVTNCSEYDRIIKNKNHSPNRVIRSKTHPLYEKIRNRMYLHNKKVLDPHYLKLLDFEVLAILIQDDGSSSSTNGKLTNLYIHTNSYSYAENLLLKKTIENNLGLMFNIVMNKGYYELRLRNKDYPKLYVGCKPYIFKSFEYKFPVPTLNSSIKLDDEIVQPSSGDEEISRND